MVLVIIYLGTHSFVTQLVRLSVYRCSFGFKKYY